ncbi:Glycosyltransferase involved in cell wall bisynthesis [Salinihabitans flavidus]|uniref:Glycosyltransferase involved in cell wall bisynthesis n=1 Tax=Salinihabitans flavidus TaxID=569882 RepID=A0A1H8V0E1_9RHOB|nr:glycosyltransferase [Salinihabitans flavidus]SEP08865.1 Glycosyltransferase involved in cell wall bisynthesis [Salinihabitans flavidus]
MSQPLPPVTILLCTANGARFLPAQLASLLEQSHADWSLWISDDGSTDGSRAIAEAFRDTHATTRDIRLIDGPRQGAAANFMSLLCHPDLPGGLVALCDQDDVWHPDKLERAARRLAAAPRERPALYGAQSVHVDEALRPIGASRPPRRAPRFANALTQNIVSGHSAAMNGAALSLVRAAGPPAGIAYHDWWLYQLISGAGGAVLIDEARVLLYRQHAVNVLGAHRGARTRLRRLAMVFGGEYGRWIDAQSAALGQAGALLTAENRAILASLRAGLGRGPLGLPHLMRAGVHRQSRAGTALFYLAATLGRI